MVDGILATPVDELATDERVLAKHMQIRLQQLDTVCERIGTQIADLESRGRKLVEDEMSDADGEEESSELETELEVIEQAGRVIETIAKQSKTLTDLYMEVSVEVDSGTMSPAAAADAIQRVEAEVDWLGEIETQLDSIAHPA